MSNLAILKWRPLLKKRSLLFRPEIDIFVIKFKKFCKESFENLQSILIEKLQTRVTTSITFRK